MNRDHVLLNATADVPDARDFMYRPALLQLKSTLEPPKDLHILDQGREGACTGFSIAATINLLNQRRGQDLKVSPRMLYEMAKIHDEWPGEDYDGSSLRGAIGGWKNMGVCSDELWPYDLNKGPGMLSIKAAKDARKNTVGAYFRLKPVISDFHAALNEAGVIAASAKVHSGWFRPGRDGVIKYSRRKEGGHAFVIVGYNEVGFWVQNSWGTGWGNDGLALWSYEDWIENLMDAWVVRLALPTPQIFGLFPKSSKLTPGAQSKEKGSRSTPRADIAGHFVHVDDGRYHRKGRYWSTPEDVEQTAKYIAAKEEYEHFLIYAHGGLNSPKASATRIASMKEGFKRNGIYPFHLIYDTGLIEELKDVILHRGKSSQERVGGFSDLTDRFLEGLLRRPGSLLWNEMKKDARVAFERKGAGTDSLKRFIKHFRTASKKGIKKKIHLVGHSTGAIVIAYLLRALQNFDLKIDSCSLMAPAAGVDLYDSHYLPILQGKRSLKISSMNVYNLFDGVERDDHVAQVYRKSLLYLVSNSFENHRATPLLGMEEFQDHVKVVRGKPKFHLSDGHSGEITCSDSHGGFDNDPHTMNHILKTILGAASRKPFSKQELSRF